MGEDQLSQEKRVVLPVSPSLCQALYRIPIEAKGQSSTLIFPKGATVAELPANVEGDGGATCTLVVVRDEQNKRRIFWKIRTRDTGFAGQIQCSTEGFTSPTFDIKAQRSQTSKLYTYASVEEQARVDSLLQAGKITATWHQGENNNNDLYEQTQDGSLKRKKGMTLYKACTLD